MATSYLSNPFKLVSGKSGLAWELTGIRLTINRSRIGGFAAFLSNRHPDMVWYEQRGDGFTVRSADAARLAKTVKDYINLEAVKNRREGMDSSEALVEVSRAFWSRKTTFLEPYEGRYSLP